MGPMAALDPENFRKLMEVNIVSAFSVLSAAALDVVDGGNIIGLTTSMVRAAVSSGCLYTEGGASVEKLLRSRPKELALRKRRVNGVAPGPVDTDLFRAGRDEATIARSGGMSPFNRVGQHDAVAEVVAYPASGKASWVHGQIIQPNGGMV